MDKFIALYEVVTNQFNPFIEGSKLNLKKVVAKEDTDNETSSHPEIPNLPDQNNKNDNQQDKAVTDKPESNPPQQNPQEPPIQQQENQDAEQPSQPQTPEQVPENSQQSQNSSPGQEQGELHPDLHFETKDGQTIKSVPELVTLLRNMASDVFSHHVNETKNDFAVWVHEVLHDDNISNEIAPIKNRLDMIQALEKHL